MCAIDWGLLAASVGAFGTIGLFVTAIYGFRAWRSQFFKSRDHELARRILSAVTSSEMKFDQLRIPYALLSDGDEPSAREPLDELPGEHDYRKMFARYKARVRHLGAARKERAVVLLEATVLWEDENYSARLGELFNQLARLEDAVTDESVKFVQNSAPRRGHDGLEDYDHDLLFAPLDDPETPDETAQRYLAIRTDIVRHLRPKLRMEKSPR